MKDAFIRLMSSMKFLTAMFGIVTIVAARYGFAVDAEVYWAIVGVFGALLAGQAAADHGKEAAKESAKGAVVAASVLPQTEVGNTNVTMITEAPRKAEAGFVDGFTMMCIAAIGIAFVFVVVIGSMVACSQGKGVGKALASSIVDCTKAGVAPTVRELRPMMGAVLTHAIDGGKLDYGKVTDLAKNFATDIARCTIADAITQLLNPPPPDPQAPQVAPVQVDKDAARAGFKTLYPGLTFKTEAGQL